ncbi:MAG: hypothetical protein AAB815_01775, partial [Patescibacteria group bacterium]
QRVFGGPGRVPGAELEWCQAYLGKRLMTGLRAVSDNLTHGDHSIQTFPTSLQEDRPNGGHIFL